MTRLNELTEKLYHNIKNLSDLKSDTSTAYNVHTANIAVLLRFEIPQKVPQGSSICATDLATATGLPIHLLNRVLRYAITNGIFIESKVGEFAHSPISAYVAEHAHVRDIANIATRELANINLGLAEALTKQYTDSKNGTIAAFNVSYPGFTDAFQFIASDHDLSTRYHRYLAGRVRTPLWDIRHLVQSWDWATKIGKGTLVDLGGSSGHTCLALAEVCAEAKFIVQDIDPRGLQQGRETVARASSNFTQRVEFVEHDLFTPNPNQADVYLFRHILHDWPDEDVVRLVQNLLPALSNGARVLVSEGIVPAEPAYLTGCLSEKQIRLEDMFMLSVHGACERTVEDFVHLFHTASDKFRFVGVTGGVGGAFQSLLEFELVM
ncbi:hypothetical protein DV737_g1686, partial [Chaetothyriales sp. CBS 132003]